MRCYLYLLTLPKGAGDGSPEITTPQKLRQLHRALYRKAKAEPKYRFGSLSGERTRADRLEHALELVARNGGAPGVDGQTIEAITARPETRTHWLAGLHRELQTKAYRPQPGRRVYLPKPEGGPRPLGIPTVRDRVVQREAWERVKANQGAAGIDEESIQDFERKLMDNLDRIWNRMSSGSYLPPPVRTVAIPKAGGGERKLGIPTVSDRVAQRVVKQQLEPVLEPRFHADSYGCRPFKSAHQAVGQARQRCWRYDWVLDLDIKGFLDNIPHELMMRAVRRHAREPWVVLYSPVSRMGHILQRKMH